MCVPGTHGSPPLLSLCPVELSSHYICLMLKCTLCPYVHVTQLWLTQHTLPLDTHQQCLTLPQPKSQHTQHFCFAAQCHSLIQFHLPAQVNSMSKTKQSLSVRVLSRVDLQSADNVSQALFQASCLLVNILYKMQTMCIIFTCLIYVYTCVHVHVLVTNYSLPYFFAIITSS